MNKKLVITALAAAAITAVALMPRRTAPKPPVESPAAPGEQVIEHFTLEGFDETGARLWGLQGDVAHVDKNMDVFIEKNVRLTVRDSTLIESDKVLWKNSSARFFTRAPVRITHQLQKIEGTGAQGRLNDEFLQINQNVRMFLDGPVFVTCWGPLKIFRKENRLVLYRDTVIHDSKGKVRADRLDVYYEDELGKIKEIVARKNVKIQRGENVSHSDTAIYNAQTQSIRLAGDPKIIVADPDDLQELEGL